MNPVMMKLSAYRIYFILYLHNRQISSKLNPLKNSEQGIKSILKLMLESVSEEKGPTGCLLASLTESSPDSMYGSLMQWVSKNSPSHLFSTS